MKLRPVSHLILAWMALLALLVLSLCSAYIPMGAANALINYAIAFAKTALVMVLFMHATTSGGFVRVLALTGLVWLLILGALGLTDYATRAPENRSQPALAQQTGPRPTAF